MQIRRANADDEKNIVNLLKQFPEGEGLVDWEKGMKIFRDIIENPDIGTVFVADEDGDVLGVITLSYPLAIRCGGPYSCIEEFIVDEKGRGKGIGGKLLEAAIGEARTKGCFELQVNRPSELGYPLYIKHGWEEPGKHLNMIFRTKDK